MLHLSGPILLCSRESLQVFLSFLSLPLLKVSLCSPQAAPSALHLPPTHRQPVTACRFLPSANFLGATPTYGWAQDNGPSLCRTAGLKGKSCCKKLDPVTFNPTGRGLFKAAPQNLSLGPNHQAIMRFNVVPLSGRHNREVMKVMKIQAISLY